MRKINIAFVQRIKEIKFMENSIPKDIVWIPLNLETYIYLLDNKKKYMELSEILDNDLHSKSLKESEKIISKLKKKFKGEDFLEIRLVNIVRKYFNSIFLIIQIIESIKKKFKINKIFLSGWDIYDLKDIKNNFIVSRIVKELYSKQFKINLLSKIKYINNDTELHYHSFKKIKGTFIYINNLGYNFFRLVKANIFSKTKIVTIDDGKLNFIKKIIFNLLGVRLLKLKTVKNNVKRNKSFLKLPVVDYKFKNLNLKNLFLHRNLQISVELKSLLNLKLTLTKFLVANKPKMIFLNFTRGINSFLISFSKKENIPCILIPHGTLSHQKKRNGKIYNSIIAEEIASSKCTNSAQTKISSNFFKNNFNKKNYIDTGNLIFSEEKKNNKQKSYVLYAVTNRDFINTQFFGIETYYEFFSNLKALDKISRKRNIKIIVKLHPGVSYLSNQLKKQFNFLIFENNHLEKLLKNAKFTISFSSTAIEDSLCSNVPVILFDQWKRYNHCAANNKINYKDSVIYLDSVKKLDKYLSQIKNIKSVNQYKDLKKYVFKNNPNNNFKSLLPKF